MEGVGSGLTVIEMGWRNPFGLAVGVLAGRPALLEQPVVGSAGKSELVDVGAVRAGPVLHVVDLGVAGGDVATGVRTATLLGVQHNSLRRRGQAFGVMQSQGFAL